MYTTLQSQTTNPLDLAGEETDLSFALANVCLKGNPTWWYSGQGRSSPDSYRQANSRLWREYLGLRRPLSIDRNMSFGCDLGQDLSSSSVNTLEANRPFKIESKEESALYRTITRDCVKNIWNKIDLPSRSRDSSAYGSVPEFLPPVLLLRDRRISAQPYSTIIDDTYQGELFPYLETSVGHQDLTSQRCGMSQMGEMSYNGGRIPQLVTPLCNFMLFQNVVKVEESERTTGGGGGGRRGLLQAPPQAETTSRGTGKIRLLSRQSQEEVRPREILVRSDFPPLSATEHRTLGGTEDGRTSSNSCPPKWTSQPFFSALDNSQLQSSSALTSTTGISLENNERRRLYKDVLVPQGKEESSEVSLERKFLELEKEALEQYDSSGTSVENVNESATEIDPFQDLERQGEEQYNDQSEYAIESVSEPRN